MCRQSVPCLGKHSALLLRAPDGLVRPALPPSPTFPERRQCAFGTCCRSFHVLCARAAGQHLTFRATDGEPLAFCELHSRPTFEKMVSGVDWGWLAGAGLESGQSGQYSIEQAGCTVQAWRTMLTQTPEAVPPTPIWSRWRSMWMGSASWTCGDRCWRGRTGAAERRERMKAEGGPLVGVRVCLRVSNLFYLILHVLYTCV